MRTWSFLLVLWILEMMMSTRVSGFSVPRQRGAVRRPPKRCQQPFCNNCPPPLEFPYCTVISYASDNASTADGSSDDSVGGGSAEKALSQAQTGNLWTRLREKVTNRSWKENLLKVSNYASLLCVLDCIILPIVTIVFPFLGIVAASPAQMEFLHELGHQVALYFVLPVGALATTMNYTQHRKLWITVLGWLGLVAVAAANAGCTIPTSIVGHSVHHIMHALHHGVLHRTTNILGCALLLGSNYLSHKQGSCGDPACCSHDH